MSSIADPASASESLLQQRPFCFFALARVASTLALQMQVVAVGWQIYQITGSAFDLGMIGLVQFVPSLFLVFLVGTVADHFDRRIVLILSVLLQALCALLLGVGSAGGWLGREVIFIAVFLLGIGRAFSSPLLQVLVSATVPARILPRAVAAFASVTQIAVIIGPALGGLMYVAGADVVYFSSFAMFILSTALVWLVRIERPVAAKPAVTLRSIFAGLAFIRSRPAVMGAISLDLFAVLLGGATALLPIYAHDILHIGAFGLGMLRSAPAIGALAMGLLLARHPLEKHVGRIMFASVAGFGLATLIFAVSHWFLLSLPMLILLGASDMVSVVIRSSFVQLQTPDEMRGRVNAVNSLFIGTSGQLGEFESGLTAQWFGTVPSVVIGGIGTLVVVAVWMGLFPPLRKVDRLSEVLANA